MVSYHQILTASRKRLAALKRLFDRRTLAGMAPGVVALALLPWFCAGVRIELREPLFSDQLLFQYTGWCLRHGMRLYRDFAMPDGPFTHLVYAVIQVLGGTTDRGFRRVDLVLQALGSASMGVLLAPATDPRRATRWLHRVAWAATVATLWLSAYFHFGWEGTCQREAYYSLFGSTGLVLLYGSSGREPRVAKALLVVGALFVVLQVFGKPTGITYAAAGALGVLVPDGEATLDRKERARFFAVGIGAALVVVLLVIRGDVLAYVHWAIKVPYVGSQFIYWRHPEGLLLTTYWDSPGRQAVATLIGGVAAIAVGLVPSRALGITLMPGLAFASAVAQGRGYSYQMMPMNLVMALVLVLVLS